MRTDHTFEPSSPISASQRVFVAHHVRRIAKNMGCSEIAAQRAVKVAQLTLSRTGDRGDAIADGARFAVAVDISAQRNARAWDKPRVDLVSALGWLLAAGVVAGIARVVYLAVVL